jgi:hypothetical protein
MSTERQKDGGGDSNKPMVRMRTSLKIVLYTSVSCSRRRAYFIARAETRVKYVGVANRKNYVQPLPTTMGGYFEY